MSILDGKQIPHSFEYILAAMKVAKLDQVHRRNLFHRPYAAQQSKRDLGKAQEKFDRLAQLEEKS